MSNFTHLHVHDVYSFLDGAGKIEDNVRRAKELGMTALASTNHNHIGGWLDFKLECEEQNIKPILGCEMYQTWDTNILSLTADERREIAIKKYEEATGLEIPTKIGKKKITKKEIGELIKDYSYDTKQYHLILLAMNQQGINNLIKLQSEAADKCTYNGRFCCDFEMLEKYNEGLICLSACLGGMIPRAIRKFPSKVDELITNYKNIFGDRFYLEIQPLDVEEQHFVNTEIVKLSQQYNIELVATNDVHYTLEEDYDDHDTLLCIGIGKNKADENRMKYAHEFWVRDYDEMYNALSKHDINDTIIEKALNNTNIIADRIESNLKIGSSKPLFPKVTLPQGLTPEQYLTLKSYKNLYKYKIKHPEIDILQYEKRLYEELDIINPKGFAPYILKIIENNEYCKSVDIPVGPGRGSAAGSLTLFLNGGTKVVDPIKYNLLFFRFLTKDRKDLPDVDTDFSYYGRDKLIKHLEDVHGQSAISHIGTYTVMGVKSGLKDFGRVLNINFNEMNEITKQIDIITDNAPSVKFKHLDKFETDANIAKLENDLGTYNKLIAKYNAFKEIENKHPELFRLTRKFEGTPRNMGIHASGVLITPTDVTDYVPTRTVDGTRVTLFTGPQIEQCNLVKLDLLGLKTLDVLDKTIKAVDPTATVDDLYEEIENHLDDDNIFKMMQDKETEGIFQMESNLFKGLCGDITPSNIHDLIVITSIARPGPLSAGLHTQYANRKKGLEESIPPLKNVEDITGDTYNGIIYQEQIMLITKKVAGFNDAQSDSIARKILAKKKDSLMKMFRQCFIFGKLNCNPPSNYNEEEINQPYYDPQGKYGTPILGAVNNGYSYEELDEFFNNLKGYSSYLFNKSHAACYSVITLCTMYLKKNMTSKFFAALLSMQETVEKIDLYSKTAKNYNINIKVPDVNNSTYDFTEKDGDILYGLKSIKGIGEASIDAIIENRPYENLADLINKVDKKYANKRVVMGLIKSGAFDYCNTNRHELINEFMTIRKDKEEQLVPLAYDRAMCMKFETEYLGTSLTYEPWWQTVQAKDLFEQTFILEETIEKTDKKNNLMGFIKLIHDGLIIEGLVFSTLYKKTRNSFDKEFIHDITIQGQKDESGKIIVKAVIDINTLDIPEEEIVEDIIA